MVPYSKLSSPANTSEHVAGRGAAARLLVPPTLVQSPSWGHSTGLLLWALGVGLKCRDNRDPFQGPPVQTPLPWSQQPLNAPSSSQDGPVSQPPQRRRTAAATRSSRPRGICMSGPPLLPCQGSKQSGPWSRPLGPSHEGNGCHQELRTISWPVRAGPRGTTSIYEVPTLLVLSLIYITLALKEKPVR